MRKIRKTSLAALAATVIPAGALYWGTAQVVLFSNEIHEIREVLATTESQGPLVSMQGGRFCALGAGCTEFFVPVVIQTREVAELRYPRAMRVNQSADVSLTYRLDPSPTTRGEELAGERSVTISGAGLQVEPSATRKFDHQAQAFWSIRAKGTGPHNLIVNTAQLFRFPHPSLAVSDGDKTEALDASPGEFLLPIMVYTIWNIPDWCATLIAWGVGGAAFVLTIPFLQDVFGKSLEQNSMNNSGSSRTDKTQLKGEAGEDSASASHARPSKAMKSDVE